MIQHFILTRSCYRQTDLKYLRYRFRLMQQFCGASLAGQTRQDFTWIVRLNPQSAISEEVAEYLESLPFPVIGICSLPPKDDASDTIYTEDSTWKPAIEKLLSPETTHVLTTRVDDDDILAPDFVARLRAKVRREKRPAAYNFPTGYILRLSTAVGSFATAWRKENNQFASLISPKNPLVLVNDATHGFIRQLGPIRIVDERPAFIWTRHPLTKSPGGRVKVTIPARKLARDFPQLAGVK